MKFAFISTMTALPWGGSEVLWAATAKALLDQGHEVCINFQFWEQPCQTLLDLEAAGASLHWRKKPFSPNEFRSRKWRDRFGLKQKPTTDELWLRKEDPDFILITFGYHIDWLPELEEIQNSGIPYAINLQVAYEDATPEDPLWTLLSALYSNAQKRFFLCEENRQIMERLLATAMEPYQIIDNPTKVRFEQAPIEFPKPQNGVYSLACIARLQFASKAQDLLVEALNRPIWKDRLIKVVFYGEDQGTKQQLESRIKYYGLESKFEFAGYTPNPVDIWKKHMGLVLCSRFEGLPMVTIEAMRMGRLAIVSACGRNPDLVDDGVNGFLSTEPTVESVERALNRAWEQREHWKSMGLKAHETIKQRYSQYPTEDFLKSIIATATS